MEPELSVLSVGLCRQCRSAPSSAGPLSHQTIAGPLGLAAISGTHWVGLHLAPSHVLHRHSFVFDTRVLATEILHFTWTPYESGYDTPVAVTAAMVGLVAEFTDVSVRVRRHVERLDARVGRAAAEELGLHEVREHQRISRDHWPDGKVLQSALEVATVASRSTLRRGSPRFSRAARDCLEPRLRVRC